jgi:hypothetical protein
MIKFIDALSGALSRRGLTIGKFYDNTNLVERRVMEDYGAMFLNSDLNADIYSRCIFKNTTAVEDFQKRIKFVQEEFGGRTIKLQSAAMNALLEAQKKAGKKITPKGTNPAARKNDAVLSSWNDAVMQGVIYWKKNANGKGQKLSEDKAAKLGLLTGDEQIKMVLELEKDGFWFHPEHNRSITVYTAIPNASQHLSLLALDIIEYSDQVIRTALAENGWFQTVFQDRPHFTYLGIKQANLEGLGLKKKQFEGRDFWIPNGV